MLFRLIFLSITIFMLSGCVTGTRNIDLAVPEYANEQTASGSLRIVSVEDSRAFEQSPRDPSTPSVKGDLESKTPAELQTLIGRQRNGYGGAMGDVALPEGQTVPGKLRELLAQGLEGRGYTIVEGGEDLDLIVEITRFWAWFSPGVFSVSFESVIETVLTFRRAAEETSFTVAGYGLNKGQVASDANWALAYERAYLDYLKNLDAALDEKGF